MVSSDPTDWVTTEPDLSRPQVTMDANNTEIMSYPSTKQITNYAKDSTSDIVLDQWGNLVITVNSEDVVVIPKPFATDAAGKRFDLEYILDKANRIITITGDIAGARYPVVIDPSERVTNGGFESGSADGWTSDSSPAPTLTIVSGGAHEGTYYCLDQGNEIWIGIAGYNRIYQTIDYTGVTSVSIAVKFFNYNRYDYVLSDNFWTGPWNYIIGYPGQQATGWITKSVTPTLSGEHLIQVWTYGGTTAGIDSTSATGAVTPPMPTTYSMTIIEDYWPEGQSSLDLIDYGPEPDIHYGGLVKEIVTEWLGRKAGWRLVFDHNNSNVIKKDFGTQDTINQGLDDAMFHYHFGHGFYYRDSQSIRSGLMLYSWLLDNSHLSSLDVSIKWDKNNKWVVFDACEVLRDRWWGDALGTSHGILGFESKKDVNPQLPASFFHYAMDEDKTIKDAWLKATQEVYRDTNIRAAYRFDNQYQVDTDHLPSHGEVAPDEYPNDGETVYNSWRC